MALSRVKIVNPGDVILSADWNNEFNNILNNPITLISPTTGAINFNLQGHTNFRVENVSADPTSTSAGKLVFNTASSQLLVDNGTLIHSIPTLLSTSIVQGDIIIAASSGNAWRRLPVGTTGQVLIGGTTGPVWSTAAPGGAGSTGFTVRATGSGSGTAYSFTASNYANVDNTNLNPAVTVRSGAEMLIVHAYIPVPTNAAAGIAERTMCFATTVAGSTEFGGAINWNGPTVDPSGLYPMFGAIVAPSTTITNVALQGRGDGTNAFTVSNITSSQGESGAASSQIRGVVRMQVMVI